MKKVILKFINDLKYYKNTGMIYVFIGSVLTKFSIMFATIFLVRAVTKNDYDILAYIDNIYGYVYLFAGLGLPFSIMRFVVLKNKAVEKYSIFTFIYKKSFIINVVLVLIGILFVFIYRHPLIYSKYIWLMIVMIMSIPFKNLIECSLFLDRSMLNAKRYAALSFLTSVGLVVFRVLGAKLSGLVGIIIFSLIIEILLGLSLLINSKKKYFKDVESIKVEKPLRKEIINYSIQFMITNGLWSLFSLNDMFLLGQLSSEENVLANFKVASVLPGSLSIISIAIGITIAPYFTKKEDEKDFRWVGNNWLKIMLISSVLISFCSFILSVFANPIVEFIYGNNYINIIPLMRLLLISTLINSGIRYTTANILMAMGKTKHNLIISMIGLIMQILLDFILIPIYGSYGVAYSGIIVNSFMALALITFFIIFIKRKESRI